MSISSESYAENMRRLRARMAVLEDESNRLKAAAHEVGLLMSENDDLTARVAALERRLGEYECPEHEKPEFGECDTCDRLNPDESWGSPEP